MDVQMQQTIDGEPFQMLVNDSEVSIIVYIGENKFKGELDNDIKQMHKLSDADYIQLLGNRNISDNYFWKLDNETNTISLFQRLELDMNSTITWAAFKLRSEKCSSCDTYTVINSLLKQNCLLESSSIAKDDQITTLTNRINGLEAAIAEYKEKTEKMEMELLQKFTVVLNAKKRKIRSLMDEKSEKI